jgi:hypothetical protein
MKKTIISLVLSLATLLVLALATSMSQAQQAGPTGDDPRPLDPQAPEIVWNVFPIQGRLTDPNGTPLNGTYTVTYRIYDSQEVVLCQDTDLVVATRGLFNGEIDHCTASDIDGRQLLLGLQINDDPEMTPRQYIYTVPYAMSLRPGAEMSATMGSNAILDIENWAVGGRGLRAYGMSTTGANYGVVGASRSPAGYGGYFYNSGGGTGLYASSDTGVGLEASSESGAALKLSGAGVLQSSAVSYLWISGNGVRPFLHTDSTYIDMDTVGGAKIYRGATAGRKNVMLPITVSGPLYGQPVRVTAMDIYYGGDTEFDGIYAVLLRRQTGVCGASNCFASLLADFNAHYCDEAVTPTGCTVHYDLTTNNLITADSGILYLTIELNFSGSGTWVDIGGVRLTLEHD